MLDRNVRYGMANNNVIWVRAAHMAGFQDRSIQCIVRPGDRTKPDKAKGNLIGVPVAVRFIKKAGNPATKRDPEFYPDDGLTVTLTECFAKKIGELTPEDLSRASPDYGSPELVALHLALVYDTPCLTGNDVVTVTRLRYLDSVKSDEEWAEMTA